MLGYSLFASLLFLNTWRINIYTAMYNCDLLSYTKEISIFSYLHWKGCFMKRLSNPYFLSLCQLKWDTSPRQQKGWQHQQGRYIDSGGTDAKEAGRVREIVVRSERWMENIMNKSQTNRCCICSWIYSGLFLHCIRFLGVSSVFVQHQFPQWLEPNRPAVPVPFVGVGAGVTWG